jgi:Ca-activated chloride channel family protein
MEKWNKAFEVVFDFGAYERPWVLWMLFCIPLFFWIMWLVRSTKVLRLKNAIVEGEKNNWLYIFWRPFVFSFAWLFLIIAWANPTDKNSWEVKKTLGIDIVFALDVSTSMLARDFRPNRLEAAKSIASEFVKERPYDRFGLVIFAGESFTQCPITVDHNRLIELFDQVSAGLLKDGTAIGEGLATGIKRLKDSDAISKVVILLTDGENNSGEIAPEVAAKLAKQFGIKVYTIGVGKKGEAEMPYQIDFRGNLIYRKMPVNIDEDLLKEIANQTRGQYFRATDNASLAEIYEAIDTLEKTELESTKYSTTNSYFLPFLTLGIIMLLIQWILEQTYFRKL